MTAMLDRPRSRQMTYRPPTPSTAMVRPVHQPITDADLTTDEYNRALAAYVRTAQPLGM
jgi:hypothetical protein